MTWVGRAWSGVVAGLAVLLGCGPIVDLDDGSGSGDATSTSSTADSSQDTSGSSTGPTPTTTVTTSTTSTTVDPDTGPGDDTTAGPVSCPMVDGFACEAPIDCSSLLCGGANSQFDEDGCLRPSCEGPRDCADGELCHAPQDWGGCASSGLSCQDDPELGCTCVGKPDCGGRFCVPAELVPPTDCNALPDALECLDAGCGPFVTGRPISDAGGGSCLCDLPMDMCIYVPPGASVMPVPTAYLAPQLGVVIKLPQAYDPPPFGWTPCEDQPGSPLCQCAMVLPCEV